MPHFPSNSSSSKSSAKAEGTSAEEEKDDEAGDEETIADENRPAEEDFKPANGLLVDLASQDSSSATTPTFSID